MNSAGFGAALRVIEIETDNYSVQKSKMWKMC
jgi:hypothetical protein